MTEYRFSIAPNLIRNVLYIEQRGRPNACDLLQLKEHFLTAARRLQPGFSIVNDQRFMEPYDDEAMEVAKDLVRLTNELQAARVVRIVPADVFSTVQLTTTLMAAQSRYPSIRVGSPEEAEEALEAFTEE
jgi:hypothetical protein